MQTYDLRVEKYEALMSPKCLIQSLPLSRGAEQTVTNGRAVIQKIMAGEDSRLLAIVGPCSIHDIGAARDYASRLSALSQQVRKTILVVMRVYFEKPRTTVGWKGLINDPDLDGSCDITTGLKMARQLLLELAETGLPAATELLDPVIPQYIADLVSWAAIGARTTESQTHREMASGLSMPVGFKNGTDGDSATAVNAIMAAREPHSFLGQNLDGQTCIVKTTGNPLTHLVLRGGPQIPNCDPLGINLAMRQLQQRGLPQIVVVDCSHGNSRKKQEKQSLAFQSVLTQRLGGTSGIIGLMLESFLFAGNQDCRDKTKLRYGVSITDECMDWPTTEALLLAAHRRLSAPGQANGHNYRGIDLRPVNQRQEQPSLA